MLVYQEFESRLMVPRIYGRVLRLSPAVVLIALLVGGTLMGILGALLALPCAAGLQMLVRQLRVELPGEAPPDASTRARDEKAEHIYEELTAAIVPWCARTIHPQIERRIRLFSPRLIPAARWGTVRS